MKVYDNIHCLVGNTPIVRLHQFETKKDVRLFAKLELLNPGGSLKDRLGEYFINKAEKDGLLHKGDTIIEATAGNTGVGIAFAAVNKGYNVIFVVPTKFSAEKLAIMRALGATIIQTSREEGMLGAERKMNELLKEIPNSICMAQFRNPVNPESYYYSLGPEIYRDMDGQIDYLVAGAGTGGSFSGTMKYLKEQNPNIKGVLADPIGSIIGGGTEHADYNIEGIGNDFIPSTMNVSLMDMAFKIADDDAYAMAKEIAKREGILCGTSSACGVIAAQKLAENIDKGNIVIIFPDRGDRYISKHIYD